MHNALSGLNEPQQQAVLHKDGALLVVAGAGAGKTKVITHRIAELVKNGVSPAAICAVTFTNKAAQEMRERIQKLQEEYGQPFTPTPIFPSRSAQFGRTMEKSAWGFIGTFHSLGVRILRDFGSQAGIKKSFGILDRADATAYIRQAMKQHGIETKTIHPRKIQAVISRYKGELLTYEYFESTRSNDYFSESVSRVWQTYQERLAHDNILDFDDLLLQSVLILQKHEDVRRHYNKRWRYLHIDEYQDTNHAQYVFARLLASEYNNVCAVADMDQCIYSWRGARVNNVLRFQRDYPNTKTIFLEENYRSTATILNAANAVIKKNSQRIDKTLYTNNSAGNRIQLRIAHDETHEARTIAREAKTHIQNGVSPENIAVLYRANFQSRALEEAFFSEGIPYSVLGTRFFQRQEVKDILSYIRAAHTPENTADYSRALGNPSRGIGKATMAKLFSGKRAELPARMQAKLTAFDTLLARVKECARTKPPAQTIRFVLSESGIEAALSTEGDEGEERLENIRELAALAARYDTGTPEKDLERFLEDAALAADQDALLRTQSGGVRLMTVHASKGLEFDVVFVSGLEQGLFPHESFSGGESAVERAEEERRLFYVALTRAAHTVHLSYAEQRMVFGTRAMAVPSEFLGDIPPELVETEHAGYDENDLLPNIE